MCVIACQKKIAQTLSRRNFLKGASLAATATLASAGVSALTPVQAKTPTPVATVATAEAVATPVPQIGFFSRVVDLTHTLSPEFPTYSGEPQLEMETLTTLDNGGYNTYRWLLMEHTGTHIDAPFHFSDGDTADLIPVTNLMGPLVVVDIRSKAEEDPDAQLTLDDLTAWEKLYGDIPPGAIIAMNSGWDVNATGDKFRNADAEGVMHFPGFQVEAVDFLLAERDVKGIMVDTLSLDYGISEDFGVHYTWLPAGKWGMECVANLGMLPPFGATVIIGGPKIAGATGGPSRVIALV